MSSENALNWGGLILGAYGAALSTILAAASWWRDRGRLSVNPETINLELGDKTIVWRLIEVVNSGRRALYLNDFGFMRMDGTSVSMRRHDAEYPLKLEEGQKHASFTIDAQVLPSEIKYVWATDSTGLNYTSGTAPYGKDA